MEYNLYLKECGKDTYKVIMSGPPENANTGIAIKWPVNPEFTGETGIIAELYKHNQFMGKKFMHSKLGIITSLSDSGIYPLK